jgi:hypothetical protein
MKTEQSGSTPANSYMVGRVKRNLMRNSFVGAIVTDRESPVAGDYNRVYGPDLHLQLYDRLEIDSYVLRSDTPNKPNNNLARSLTTVWRDDELTVAGEYSAVQANFNPEVGFVRRGNMGQYSGEVAWLPQLQKSNTIRNLTFDATVDYFKGGDGKIETRAEEATLGMDFENNGYINFVTTNTFDRLVRPFAIRPNVSIPVGDYDYRSYALKFNGGSRRRLNPSASVGWGEFWNGDTRSVTGGLDMRPNYHLNINLSYSRNAVTLPTGPFTTNLVGAKVLYGFTPRLFINAFIQYNADTHQVSSNYRFDITHHPLSDLYLVYNDRRDTTSGQLVERALILKLTNLFNF